MVRSPHLVCDRIVLCAVNILEEGVLWADAGVIKAAGEGGHNRGWMKTGGRISRMGAQARGEAAEDLVHF